MQRQRSTCRDVHAEMQRQSRTGAKMQRCTCRDAEAEMYMQRDAEMYMQRNAEIYMQRDAEMQRRSDAEMYMQRDAGAEMYMRRCRCRDAYAEMYMQRCGCTPALQPLKSLQVVQDSCVSTRGGAVYKRRKQEFVTLPDCRKGRSHSPAATKEHGLMVIPCRTYRSRRGAKQGGLRLHTCRHALALHCTRCIRLPYGPKPVSGCVQCASKGT